MKRNFIILAAAGAVALGGLAIAQTTQTKSGPCAAGGRGHGAGFGLEHLASALDLTADQQAKVQPIIDQAKPQLIAIHQEAMQKAHTVIDGAMAQIRPLLTADQQQKLEDLKKARAEMRNARQKFHDAIEE